MPSDDVQLRVLRLLQDDPHLTQRELAEALGVSLGKANYCLKALLAKGQVKMQNFSRSNNKLGYAYLLTPSGVTAKATLTAQYLKLKLAEYEALKREITQLQEENRAGAAAGVTLEQRP